MQKGRDLRLEANFSSFKIVDSFTTLGLTVSNDLTFLETYHDKTINKLTNIANFWKRFKLSFPGRINIAKTLLYSQIGYIGCIITPTNEQIKLMEEIIFNYVRGNLSISKEKCSAKPEVGGIGLIDIKQYIVALQVNWVKRALESTRDNWRYDLIRLTSNNPLTLSPMGAPKNRYPIIWQLATSWQAFIKCYYNANDNFKKSFLVNNPNLKRSAEDDRLVDQKLFDQRPPLPQTQVVKIRFSDFFENGQIKSLETINFDLNLPVNLLTYMRVATAITLFINRLKVNRKTDGTSVDIVAFMNRPTKGSKRYRLILENSVKTSFVLAQQRTVKSYYRIITMRIEREDKIMQKIGFWNQPAFPNPLREFIFKFFSNQLATNTRVSHFGENVQRACSLCNSHGIQNPSEETFLHIFLECPITTVVRKKFQSEFFPEIDFTQIDLEKRFWFLCEQTDQRLENLHIETSKWIFKYLLWEGKLKKHLKSWYSLKIDFFFMMENIITTSEKIKMSRSNNNLHLCRNWAAISTRPA